MLHMKHQIILGLLAVILLLSGCSTASRSFSKGEDLEEEGRFEEAMYKYADAYAKDPEVKRYRVRYLKARETAANLRFKTGSEYFAKGDYQAAMTEFQAALALDPTKTVFKQRLDNATRLRDAQNAYNEGMEFEKANKLRDASVAFARALEFAPDNKEFKTALQRVRELRTKKAEGSLLNLKSGKPITLRFNNTRLKDAFGILGRLSGINFIFDDTVKDQPVTMHFENATFEQALELLTNLFKLGRKIPNDSTVLIYPRTPDKIKQYEDMHVRTFHLNFMDAKKAVNLIRGIVQVRKIHVIEEANSIVLRDTDNIIQVVERILEANDVPDPEVILDVEVIEVSDKNTQNLGLLLSNYNVQLGAFSPDNKLMATSLISATTSSASTTTSTNADITNLVKAFSMRGYGGFVTVPYAQYNFGKTLAKGEVLSNPKIRVKNKEKSKFTVGTRLPITTTSTTGTTGGYSVNVQYVDVGVKLSAEPNIQINNEIAIKLTLEVSSMLSKDKVGESGATTVVTIGTRNLETVLSLKDGETSIIGGLIQNTKSNTQNKVFLLGDLPLIGPLLSNHDTTKDKSELVLAITPRLVRGVTIPQGGYQSFASGKEDDPSLAKPLAAFEKAAEDKELSKEKQHAQQPVSTMPVNALPLPVQLQQTSQPVQQVQPVTHPPFVQPAQTLPTIQPASAPAGIIPLVATNQAPQTNQSMQQIQPATPLSPVQPALALSAIQSQTTPAGAVAAPKQQQQTSPAPNSIVTPAATSQTTKTPQLPAPAQQPTPVAATAAVPVQSSRPAPVPVAAAIPARPGLLQFRAPATMQEGKTFDVEIKLSGVNSFSKAAMDIVFPAALVQFVSANDGGLLQTDGGSTKFSSTGSPTGGKVSLSIDRSKAKNILPDGSVIGKLAFKAIKKGRLGFSFANVSLSYAEGQNIVVMPFSSAFDIR